MNHYAIAWFFQRVVSLRKIGRCFDIITKYCRVSARSKKLEAATASERIKICAARSVSPAGASNLAFGEIVKTSFYLENL